MSISIRTPEEIRAAFEQRGCSVAVESLGHSYRAGGEIFILAPGISMEGDAGVKFTRADFAGFEGTGYDGRGRRYAVWLVTAGDYVPCSVAVYQQADADKRHRFGDEGKSCSSLRHFAHRDEVKAKGLGDLAGAFAALGL